MGMDTNRAQHMPENSLLMQMGCQSTRFGCSDLSFRLFCADVPLICGISLSAWAEDVTYQVAGAALGAQHGCEQGLSPCHHKKLFVSGLCPQPQLVLTW